jgi:Flp pilus assembly pilin Flp
MSGRVRELGSGRPAAGQGVVEYGLILILAVVVCVVALVFFGDQLSSLLSLIATGV